MPVFHYTRKWLQKHAQSNMERAPQQLKMADRWTCQPSWRSRCG